MEKPVIFETENQTAIITLNRPERHNAINQELLILLYDCIDNVSTNDDIKVAIITGNGKSFCSGIDLKVIGKDNLFDPRGDGIDMPAVFQACSKPIIGAVNGVAITGGFEIALNCDFLIASESASFTDSHAKVGIHPGWGMTQLLQQAVGRKIAMQLSCTCQPMFAHKALECGLVNEVVPQEELLQRAKQIASNICDINQDMLATVKQLIEYRDSSSMADALTNERNGFLNFIKKMKL